MVALFQRPSSVPESEQASKAPLMYRVGFLYMARPFLSRFFVEHSEWSEIKLLPRFLRALQFGNDAVPSDGFNELVQCILMHHVCP
jgi:hypothetical protein